MEQEKPALRQSLQSAIRNKPFVVGLLLFLVTWIAIDVLQSTLLFFIKYVVQRESQSDLIMASIFVTAILALPVWNWASQRWSKRWAYVAGIAFWVGVQMVLISLNPATSLTVILFMCILAGLGVSAAHVLTWAMIPDAVEWGEWQTGERNEGMLYSLTTLVRKVTASLAVPAVGLILQVTGYVPNAAQQPERALLGIRIAFGPLPAALLCLGILFALLYPLGREEYAKIVHELAERRTAATEEVA